MRSEVRIRKWNEGRSEVQAAILDTTNIEIENAGEAITQDDFDIATNLSPSSLLAKIEA